ncbi:MAG: addiction module toxin, HicA family [Desulfobacteraceae bacterium 4572_88]|nr:MAG: addiction module toxin, HicA family [Desulfobacteraceae bacterium 4572_88]
MKRHTLLKHLRMHGCYLKREGASHSLWCNPETGHAEAIPRHMGIPNKLVSRICQKLSVPQK